MARPATSIRRLRAPPLRIDQRTQIVEPVGGHQAGRDQFPQPVFHFGGQQPRPMQQLAEKTRAPRLQATSNGLCRATQTGGKIQTRQLLTGGRQQDRPIFARKDADGCDPGRNHATSLDRIQFLHQAGMRRQTTPHQRPTQTEPIEPLGLILGHANAQDL